jgi:hypothetical protein
LFKRRGDYCPQESSIRAIKEWILFYAVQCGGVKYKEILWDKIKDMVEIAGYEVDKIKLELIEGNNIVRNVMS